MRSVQQPENIAARSSCWPPVPGAGPSETCWGSIFRLFRYAVRCGQPRHNLPGCSVPSARRNPVSSGAKTTGQTLRTRLTSHKNAQRLTRHLYGRQRKNGEVIFGGDRESLGYIRHPEQAGIDVNKAHATEVLPLLSGLPISRIWSGLMPFCLMAPR